ncbi:MAG: ABC transporter ATP-binding protein [Nanoarchaeota archaeon]
MKEKRENIDYGYNLREYLSILKNYKYHFTVLLLIILIVESTFFVDKFLFKLLIDNGTSFTSNEVSKDDFVKILIGLASIFSMVIVIRFLGRWLHLHLINRLDANLIIDLKKKYFNHLIHLSHGFHTSHKTGSLIARLIRGSGAIERITDVVIFNVVPLTFQVLVGGFSLIYFDKASAVVFILTGIAFVVYGVFIQNAQREANLRANEVEDIEKANISDIFTNIDSIKYFGKELNIKKRFEEIAKNTKLAFLKSWDYYRWLDSGQTFIIGIGTLFIIYFPLTKFLDNALTLGTLTFIYTVYGGLLGSLFGFVHGIREYYRSMADFNALFQYGKIKNEIKDKENAKELKIRSGIIEFRGVLFSYHKRKIFNNFNLKINENEKVALVGYSGSGKTTLIKLLYRFYDVDKGEVLIDGKDVKDFKQESLRSELSVVPQECILFDDTIYNNIAFSNPKASREKVLQAMKFAQLDKIVKIFPKKENTIVGERGVKLSGGEKQRVSIARAILANKKILVLDEATSSLDSQTEHDIQRDLQKLMQGRTSIIIAHRLSTIMRADRIIVMDNGKIVQIGKHNKLIKQKGLYKRLWSLQKGGYIE